MHLPERSDMGGRISRQRGGGSGGGGGAPQQNQSSSSSPSDGGGAPNSSSSSRHGSHRSTHVGGGGGTHRGVPSSPGASDSRKITSGSSPSSRSHSHRQQQGGGDVSSSSSSSQQPPSASPSLISRLHVPGLGKGGSSSSQKQRRVSSASSEASRSWGGGLFSRPGPSGSDTKGNSHLNRTANSSTGGSGIPPSPKSNRSSVGGGAGRQHPHSSHHGGGEFSSGGPAAGQPFSSSKRCVPSPGSGAPPSPDTPSHNMHQYYRPSSSPYHHAEAAGGGGGRNLSPSSQHHGIARPVSDSRMGSRPDTDPYSPYRRSSRDAGGGGTGGSLRRADSTGVIIDRSKFILENAGVLTDFYDIDTATLGQGTYGSVSKARKKDTGQWRAVKTISKSQVKNLERFRQEIAIMKDLDHPNVIKLFETFEDHRNIYLVMELCTGGELFDRIISEGRLTEKQAAILMKQMFSAVHYLHSNHIMHRDLKPENFLFLDTSRDSPLKIIDFGLSCRFKTGDFVSTKAGTPYYVAPQVLQGKYDCRCDAWSLGVILYILLCGYPPFYGETDAEVLTKVKAGVFSFSGPEWKRVSEEAKDLIRQLIKIHPAERFTAEQALHHSWVTTLARNSQNVALPSTLMSNLKTFRAQNKLKKAALTVIAQHMSEKEINHLRQIFVNLDVDNSGTLSVHEIREGLKRLGWTEIPADLQAIIEEVDSDRSGHIDYTEFIAATMDKKLYMKEDVCWAAFRVFDLDGNGKISQDELRKVLGMPDVETAVGRATIDALLSEVDLNGDGEIDFDEFMYMMRKKEPSDKRFDPSASTKKTVHAATSNYPTTRRSTLSRPALTVTPPVYTTTPKTEGRDVGGGDKEREEEEEGGEEGGNRHHSTRSHNKIDAEELATTPGFSGTTTSGTPACAEL